MKSFLFILSAFLISFECSAQNYQCLQPGMKSYFTNSDGYLKGIRIDSVRSAGTDTIYYPFHSLRGKLLMSATLLDSTGGSWLGKRVIKQADGTFLFDNLWADTIVIRTQAQPGDSWVFYNDTTSRFYIAKMISSDTMTVMGAIDSVKNILITAHDTSGIITADPADSLVLILSKNFGFAQVPDLFTFPYHAPNSAYHSGLDYFLDGIVGSGYFLSRQKVTFNHIDLINQTMQQLYDWHSGEVYEYSKCNGLFEHFSPNCSPVEQYLMDTVTSVTVLGTYTNYTYSGWQASFAGPVTYPPGSLYSVAHATGTNSADDTHVIDTTQMPEEFPLSHRYLYQPNDSSYCTRGILYTLLGTTAGGDLYYDSYYPTFEGYYGPTTYKAPLGLLSFFNCNAGTWGFEVYDQELIYYDRGGSPCGAATIPPTKVLDPELNIVTSVYPNPAFDELNIKASQSILHLSISSLTGQEMMKGDYHDQEIRVDISRLAPGVYFLKVNGTEIHKFVKE